MEQEKIVELMKSANIPVGKVEAEWWELVDGVPTQLTRLIALVEKETLERAAKVCEEISDEYARTESRRYPELKTDAETGASDCEHAILKLKDSND